MLGDPKEEAKAGVGLGASAQVQITGVYYDSAGSPVIDKIEFAYAG